MNKFPLKKKKKKITFIFPFLILYIFIFFFIQFLILFFFFFHLHLKPKNPLTKELSEYFRLDSGGIVVFIYEILLKFANSN